MTGNVIDFAERSKAAPAGRRLRLRLDEKTGALTISEINAKGGAVNKWEVAPDRAKTLLETLMARLRKFEAGRYYTAHPEARPTPKKPRAWHTCRLTMSGNMSARGCARRTGHEGPHRDRGGNTWAAAFPHHRLCQSGIVHGGVLPPGVTVRIVDVPPALHALFGPVSHIHVDAAGLCTRCRNPVGPRVVP